MNNNIIVKESKEEEKNIMNYFLLFLLFLLIAIIVISVYYRYYVSRFGFEPFNPPQFFPNIIFPRPSKDPLLRSTIERNLDLIFLNKSEQ